FGSLLLGFGLGYMRVLPGTRRPRARTQEQIAEDELTTWSPNRGVYHAGTDAGAQPQFNVTPALYTPPQKASAPRLQPPRAMEAQAAAQAQPQQAASRESAIGSTHTFHLSGFFSRFGRFVLGFVVMGGIGAVMCGAPDAARNGIVFVALGLA